MRTRKIRSTDDLLSQIRDRHSVAYMEMLPDGSVKIVLQRSPSVRQGPFWGSSLTEALERAVDSTKE